MIALMAKVNHLNFVSNAGHGIWEIYGQCQVLVTAYGRYTVSVKCWSRHMGDIRWEKTLIMIPAQNKVKNFSRVKRTTKAKQ